MTTRRRLDAEVVRRGLAPSREQAARLIADGAVLVDGAPAAKSSSQVHPGQDVKLLRPPPPFVSRAGGKLAGALDAFSIDPTGWRCLDAGSSTGGFTDCLLQRGARSVVAVDVGTNQLHERLRADARVSVHEQTDVRTLTLDIVGAPVDCTVGDLSFISLTKVLEALISVTAPNAPMLLLVKPQFEAGRVEASRGRGIITDPAIWRRVVVDVADRSAELGAPMVDVVASSVTGTNGNVEFVGRFHTGAPATAGVTEQRIDEVIAGVVAGGVVPGGVVPGGLVEGRQA